MITDSEKCLREVSRFINSFNTPMRETEEKFLRGKCYWFARILRDRFKPFYRTEIVYNPVENHFACDIFCDTYQYLFDASGLICVNDAYIVGGNGFVEWKDYVREEPIGAKRIYRDCILDITPEEWDELSTEQMLIPQEL